MSRLFLATNNGDVSGGEMMLFALAEAARELGVEVQVVAPRTPDEVCVEASRRGFTVRRLAADSRPAYMAQLARFAARHRRDWFWANGLVPSTALLGHRRTVVHLHQIPKGSHRLLAAAVLRGPGPKLVPSHWAAARIPGAEAFPNWVPAATRARTAENKAGATRESGEFAASLAQDGVRTGDSPRSEPLRIGFLGRLAPYKGVHTLARAVAGLADAGHAVILHLAGEYGYIEPSEKATVGEALSLLGPKYLVRHGRVRPADFFKQIDLLVVPSEVQEIFGLVAAEAMSAGVPVVISDDGALPEVLGPGHPWIFRVGDVEDLTRVLNRAARDLQERPLDVAELVERAALRWRKHYSPAAGRERVAGLLQRIGLLGTRSR